MTALDTSNRFSVCRTKAGGIVILELPMRFRTTGLDPHEAENLAAWLHKISGLDTEFIHTLAEIEKP